MHTNLEIIVPYKRDSAAREKNREKFEGYWNSYIYTIVEDYNERSKAYNNAARNSTAEYIVLGDIDAIIPREQIAEAMALLKDGADLVYPFDHILNIYDEIGRPPTRWPDPYIYGLFPIFRRESFLKMGGENEMFRGYGCEDIERYYRALNHDFIVRRVSGPAYHMDHGWKSRVGNPHIKDNWELMKHERDKYESRIIYRT